MFFNAGPRKGWNTHKVLKTVFGASETLYACNTYQFADYSRYDFNLFTEEEKRVYRDSHFDEDLAPLLGHPLRGQPSAGGYSARALGSRLVEKALADALQAK